MIAGKLKYRLEVHRLATEETGASGSLASVWRSEGIILAERARLSGRRSVEAGELFADYDATYNVRIAHKVEPGMRVREIGGNLYDVVAVEPNRERGMLSLRCMRVNE